MTHPLISVIIPTYRRYEPLVRTLTDLLRQDYARFEVIVADQNPSWPDDMAKEADRLRADRRVRWMTLSQPGVVAARNRAVAHATGDVFLFLDDDVLIPHEGLLARHAAHYDDPSVSAIVGRERQVGEDATDSGPLHPSSTEWLPAPPGLTPLEQTLRFDRNGTTGQWVCTFSTCNGSIRRSAFMEVGGFDESFGGNSYGDDYDLALRLNAARLSIRYDPSAWLVHRRVPMGGLRLSDGKNKVRGSSTAQGLWLFVLRHGHRGTYVDLVLHHVLRKTILLKQNLMKPWRQPAAVSQSIAGLVKALALRSQGPRSPFQKTTPRATGTDARSNTRA